MENPPQDDELPRLLSLAAHEVRNPLSTLIGYIGFVMRDKRAEIPEQHRQWLQTALNSCGRIHEVADQLSEYSRMTSGEIKLNRSRIELRALVGEAIDALPVFADREVAIEVATGNTSPSVHADAKWLKRAITSIVDALRREVGSTNKLYVRQDDGEYEGKPAAWILIGDNSQMEGLRQQPKDALGWFDDKERGNLGLSIWIAKWVLNAHGGGLWAPATARKGGGGFVALPHA